MIGVAYAFVVLPGSVLTAKVTPDEVEGTMFALFASIINFGNGVVSVSLGNWLAEYYDLDGKNFDNYVWVTFIQLLCVIINIPLIWLIPTQEEIDKYEAEKNKLKA